MNQPSERLQGGKTGWPPGLLQDDSRELSRWFASRPDARAIVDRIAAEILASRARPNGPGEMPASGGSARPGG